MGVLFLASLAVFVLAVAVGTTVAVRRALAAYRAFKSLGAGLGGGFGAIADASAGMPDHLDAAARSGRELAASLARLRVSLARATVLRNAFDDAVNPVRRLRGFHK